LNNYVITYNAIKNGDRLFNDYETITGKTAKEALKNHFRRDFQRLFGEDGRYADAIIVKGTFENNVIRYIGMYQQLCFKAL